MRFVRLIHSYEAKFKNSRSSDWSGQLSLLTKHGRPLCVTVPMDDLLLQHGVPTALAVQLYRARSVSIGVATRIAGVDLEAFMNLLGSFGIVVIDYDPTEIELELSALG